MPTWAELGGCFPGCIEGGGRAPALLVVRGFPVMFLANGFLPTFAAFGAALLAQLL